VAASPGLIQETCSKNYGKLYYEYFVTLIYATQLILKYNLNIHRIFHLVFVFDNCKKEGFIIINKH